MKDNKNTWGGHREGAGRKRIAAKTLSFRASQSVVDYVESSENRTETLRRMCEWAVSNREQMEREWDGTAILPMHGALPYADIRIACGVPLDVGDRQMDMMDAVDLLTPHAEGCMVIAAEGESMIGDGVMPGDKLVIDTTVTAPGSDALAVCELNGEYTLKHVVRRGDRLYLVPSNPAFREVEVSEDDSFAVRGVVRSIIKQLF